MAVIRLGWTGYLLTGALAVVASWMMSGCRFGNNVEIVPPPVDPVTGYYQARPQSLQFCATRASTSSTECGDAAVNKIPYVIAAVVSNPVALRRDNPETGASVLFAPEGEYALPIYADAASGDLSYVGSAAPETLWVDSDCTTTLYLEESGKFEATEIKEINGYPARGRIELIVRVFNTYDGDCAADLAEIMACYGDPAQCGGADASENELLQEIVQENYSPYIDAGVLTVGDIPDVTALGYEVSYE